MPFLPAEEGKEIPPSCYRIPICSQHFSFWSADPQEHNLWGTQKAASRGEEAGKLTSSNMIPLTLLESRREAPLPISCPLFNAGFLNHSQGQDINLAKLVAIFMQHRQCRWAGCNFPIQHGLQNQEIISCVCTPSAIRLLSQLFPGSDKLSFSITPKLMFTVSH